jgi:hypothetical protein
VNNEARRTHFTLRHTLAGLEAGVAGALFMIVWSMLGSLWSRRSIWMIPNLYATAFYGSRVYVNQFTRGSWSGVALMVLICGIGGMFWGAIWRDARRPFLTLFGAVAGLSAYYLLFNVLLRSTNPLIPLYAPEPQMQIGYLLWGIALSRSPLYSRRIARAMSPADSQEAEEIRSGEVIP